MGSEGEQDPQKMKKIAAATYEYENDPRWSDYWSNILIPPQMASRSDVIDHYKRKFYQRYIVRTQSLVFVFVSNHLFMHWSNCKDYSLRF